MRLLITDRKLFASFGSSSLQNRAAVFAGHARSEPVFVHAFPFAGLKGSFHSNLLFKVYIALYFSNFCNKNQGFSFAQ